MEPLRQIDQTPARHPVDWRDRAALDGIDQCLALHIVQPRPGAGHLAIQKSIRAAGIEPDHPVPHDLKPDAADPSYRDYRVVNLGQGQKAPRLVGTLRAPRQPLQRCPVKSIPQADR